MIDVTYTIIAGILVLWTFAFGDPPHISIFFISIALMLAINLAIEPNSSTLALEPMGEMAGIASSIYGTIFFSVGSSLGSVISMMMVDRVFPIVIRFIIVGVLGLALVCSPIQNIRRSSSGRNIFKSFKSHHCNIQNGSELSWWILAEGVGQGVIISDTKMCRSLIVRVCNCTSNQNSNRYQLNATKHL